MVAILGNSLVTCGQRCLIVFASISSNCQLKIFLLWRKIFQQILLMKISQFWRNICLIGVIKCRIYAYRPKDDFSLDIGTVSKQLYLFEETRYPIEHLWREFGYKCVYSVRVFAHRKYIRYIIAYILSLPLKKKCTIGTKGSFISSEIIFPQHFIS